jgi:nitrous oxidase accessory protein NosD
MNNKLCTVVLMCLVVTSGFLGFALFESEVVGAASTLYVGGGGGNNYTSIQGAIDAAIPGDTIYVFDDSSPYNENVIVNKSVNLIGENKDTTVIYGGSSGARVRIESDWVNISGFTVTGVGPFDSNNRGIYIDYSSHIGIDDVNISHNL